MLTSCESSYNQVQILLKNSTDNTLFVKLFPKEEFELGNLYSFSSIGSGYRETTFSMEPGMEQDLFISDDLDVKPYDLVSQVFDSIHMALLDLNNPEFKFSVNKVIGYPENMYLDNSSWNYEKQDYSEPTMFHITIIHSNNYTFKISPVEKK